MPLNRQQRQMAQLIYSAARARGVSPQHALELVNAAYSESGLNPGAVNKTSGAGGLFQLLSSGYVNRANQLGGVGNPRANLLAILPQYQRYWAQHPGAAPGEAARDVERSGKGAGFYSGALGQLSQAVGGAGTVARPVPAAPAMAQTQQQIQQPGVNPRAAFAQALIAANQASSHGRPPDYSQFGALESAIRQPSVAAAIGSSLPEGDAPLKGDPRGGIRELFYDPLGGIKGGRQIGAIGGHSDHVHVALSSLADQLNSEREARRLGLRVGQEQNVDVTRVHTPTSYHYRNFPGSKYREAADVSGNPRSMAAFFRWVARNYGSR